MKKHIDAVHKNIAKYICQYPNCNKRFRTGYRLYVHDLSHKGIKPFQCTFCQKRFTEKGTLKVHIQSHSIIDKFQCKLCEFSCKTNSSLREHYKYKHNLFK